LASITPVRRGAPTYIEPVKFPAGLGCEAAGNVDSVGRDVGGVVVGDEVNVIPSFSVNQCHTYGEVILVPDHAVVKHPKSPSFTEAASVWMMSANAYDALKPIIDRTFKVRRHGESSSLSGEQRPIRQDRRYPLS
jgi:NADPH:quinone reductase-like Zn-dependent oxidoreductase